MGCNEQIHGTPGPTVKWTWLRLLINFNSSCWPMDVPWPTEIDISLDLAITKRYEHFHLPSYIHPNSPSLYNSP